MELAGKNVLVFGAAISGISAAETLLGAGARVTLADEKNGINSSRLMHCQGWNAGQCWRWDGRTKNCLMEWIC